MIQVLLGYGALFETLEHGGEIAPVGDEVVVPLVGLCFGLSGFAIGGACGAEVFDVGGFDVLLIDLGADLPDADVIRAVLVPILVDVVGVDPTSERFGRGLIDDCDHCFWPSLSGFWSVKTRHMSAIFGAI